ncbi:hypothetical protein MMC30_006698 [Trapelia coarctata]|nr:hypothetical protein [Trapelia coarctata]
MSGTAPTPAPADPIIRFATEEDVPTILALIHNLAAYENASASVLATESSLLQTLTFPSNPSHGYAKTLLIFPPTPPPSTDPASPLAPPSPSPHAPQTAHPALPASSETTASPPPRSPEPPCAGMALFFTNYSTWRSAPGIYLEDLFVRPEYRGRGYGTRLLQRLAQETERMGGKRLEWSVLKWNEPSVRFYEGIGAVRMEEWVGMRVEGGALGRLARGEGMEEMRGEGGGE